MSYTIDDFRKKAKTYADELDIEGLMNSIDFSKVDTKKLKKIDFSRGVDAARQELDRLPKVRITTQPPAQEHSEGGFIGGLVLGVVLGAILALLLAPKSGHDTRELVANTVGDLKDKVAGDEDGGIDIGKVVDVEEEEAEDVFADAEPAIERTFG